MDGEWSHRYEHAINEWFEEEKKFRIFDDEPIGQRWLFDKMGFHYYGDDNNDDLMTIWLYTQMYTMILWSWS